MTTDGWTTGLHSRLWRDNPGLIRFLGICPLLAVNTSLVNGIGLGIITLLVLVFSNTLVSSTRHWLADNVRIPVYVLIVASLVTCAELIAKAWFPTLDQSLGIFIPLVVAHCVIVARPEPFDSQQSIGTSMLDGFSMGLGFALLLMVIGAFRELIGQARILGDLNHLFSDVRFDGFAFADQGFLLFVLPPGAFISLALAVAAKNALDRRKKQRT